MYSSAMARPIPVLPPVMMAVLPWRRFLIGMVCLDMVVAVSKEVDVFVCWPPQDLLHDVFGWRWDAWFGVEGYVGLKMEG